MKKFIVSFILCCIVFSATYAQEFLNIVPSNATVVVKYSGDNFSKTLPVEKLDRYGFIKNDLFKTLHFDKRTTIKNIGIDEIKLHTILKRSHIFEEQEDWEF